MAKRRRGRRRGFRGLGALRGVGGVAIPVVAGAVLTAGTTIGLRAFLRPDPGTMSETLYRWAPAIGSLAGLLGAGALYFMSGVGAAMPAAITAIASGGFVLGAERLNAAKPGGMMAVGGGSALPAEAAGTAGIGALMPEYGTQGLGAIVMDPLGDPSGETVNVRGLGAAGYRPDAFGRSPV